jgi:hypothetical protein
LYRTLGRFAHVKNGSKLRSGYFMHSSCPLR